MAEEKPPSEDERRFLEVLEKSALENYPNPERKGCPGREFIEQLAINTSSVPMSDRRIEHVTHCSPCFKELLDIRRGRKRRRVGRWLSVAAAAAAIIGAVIWVRSGDGARKNPDTPQSADGRRTPESLQVAQLNLQNRPITRGVNSGATNDATLKLPQGRLKVTVLLPFGSEDGRYDVQILKEVDSPLVTASGTASIESGATRLAVQLDVHAIAPGKYLIGIRRPPLDWSFYPLVIQ
jgi:hypothetical protein